MTQYFGIYEGKIIDNVDPLKLNRVKIRVLFLHGTPHDKGPTSNYLKDTDLPWAQCVQPLSNISWVPDIGDIVYVQFLNGHSSYPVVIGMKTLLSKSDNQGDIPATSKSNYVNSKTIETAKFKIEINDSEEYIKVWDGTNYFKLDAKNSVMELNGNGQKAVLGDLLKTYLDALVDSYNSHEHNYVWAGPSGSGITTGNTAPATKSTSYQSAKVKLS